VKSWLLAQVTSSGQAGATVSIREDILHRKVSAIVAPVEPSYRLQACIDSVRRTGVSEIVIASSQAQFAAAMNVAVAATTGEILLIVPSIAELRPDSAQRHLCALESNDGLGVAYGDYEIAVEGGPKALRRVFADPLDLSEWSTFGYVRAIRRSLWNETGGCDTSYYVADDYDLRLRLGARGGFARIDAPLYEIVLPAQAGSRDTLCTSLSRYFTPETSAVSGYGYLFLQADLRAEVQRAFMEALRRTGALLEHRNAPIECPHHGAHPVVSVIIPTYNRKPLLCRAVESVIAGTFEDFEIIVVDNGSTDGSVGMVEAIARQEPRVRLILNPGRNQVSVALNLGIKAARGKYVSQLDSDDEYTADTLSQQVGYLETFHAAALAISYYEVIDEDGKVIPEIGVIRHDEYDRNNILRTSGAGAVRTWHRCAIENLGGFDESTFGSYAEDYDLILKASERYDVGRVPATLYRCRRHQTNSEQRLDVLFRAERKAEARRRAILRRRVLNHGLGARG
jgi:GT2 family glycosyltransferase